jgi:hypothetical protein
LYCALTSLASKNVLETEITGPAEECSSVYASNALSFRSAVEAIFNFFQMLSKLGVYVFI